MNGRGPLRAGLLLAEGPIRRIKNSSKPDSVDESAIRGKLAGPAYVLVFKNAYRH